MKMVLVCLMLSCCAELARAEEPPAPDGGAAKPAGDFDFALTPEAPKKSLLDQTADQKRIAEIDAKVKIRRNVLLAHQAFGFITLGLLAAADILGTLVYVDKFSGNDNGSLYNVHAGFAGAASATFATTGILALAAPNPYPKAIKLDTALLHKLTMAIATACFAAQLIMGPISSAADGKLYQRDMDLAHLTIGYAAFGFMAVGTIAYMVK